MPSMHLLKRLQTQRGGHMQAFDRAGVASPATGVRNRGTRIQAEQRDGSVRPQSERFTAQEEIE
jgi:hypothetical protein